MKSEEYEELMVRSFTESLSESEKAELQKWIDLSPENNNNYKSMKKTWEILGSNPVTGLQSAEEGWELFEKKMKLKSPAEIYHLKAENQFSIFRIAVSAAAVFIASFCVYYFAFKAEPEIEFITGKNETKIIYLPDSSAVYLNSSSRIAYTENEYATHSRKIRLNGEAYFEVKRNPSTPFSVETGNSRVVVLGTKFNVKFINKKTELRVKEGRVAFSSLNDKIQNPVEVAAGYKSQCDGLHDAEKPEPMQINIADGWRENLIVFENQSFIETMDILSEKFSVKIISEKIQTTGQTITAKYETGNIELVLTDICNKLNLWYEHRNGIYIMHRMK